MIVVVDDGIAPAVEVDALGQHLGAYAAPVARDRVEDQFQPGSAHVRLTSRLLVLRVRHGEHTLCLGLATCSAAMVRPSLVGEYCKPSTHEAGHAVGVATRASAVNQVTDLQNLPETWSTRSAVGQPVQ